MCVCVVCYQNGALRSHQFFSTSFLSLTCAHTNTHNPNWAGNSLLCVDQRRSITNIDILSGLFGGCMMDQVSLSLSFSSASLSLSALFFISVLLHPVSGCWGSSLPLIGAKADIAPPPNAHGNSSASIRPLRVISNRSNRWTFASPFCLSLLCWATNYLQGRIAQPEMQTLHGDWHCRRKELPPPIK